MKRTIITCDNCKQQIDDHRLPIKPRFDLWAESVTPSFLPIRNHYHFCNASCLFGWVTKTTADQPVDTTA